MTHDYKMALEVIKHHNKWRRGAEIDMTEPKLLGVALDTAIHALETVMALQPSGYLKTKEGM